MNKLELTPKNPNLDYIGIAVFTILIIFWCDLDIQGWLVSLGLNTNIRLGITLCIMVLLGILIYKKNSRTLGILVFVLLLLITKTMLTYTELFTVSTTSSVTIPVTTPKSPPNTTTNPNIKPISEFSGSADEVQQFLLRQIADDPNTTTVDKRVMSDLTEKYFKTSSKLAELRNFNIASETANILPGQQLIVGIDTVKNQH